ncbi:DUF2806 domain-containing protein [Microbulbifer sp. ZKSA002]|uniref:DUF2806 domain-containing protein n=1 Tax=Microbulbifer sp. ZKSA002 TaxID=3243388 RepID=UPI0040396BB3
MDAIIPGEKLLIKMWDSFADKGFPALLGPWQKRRMAKATADEMRILAQAEKEVADIKAGDITVQLPSSTALLEHTKEEKGPLARIEPPLDLQEMTASVASAELADSFRKEVNATKAIMVAESILSRDTQEPSDKDIDSDWLHRWRDYAGRVSAEQLQELWGRVLAGEVKQPGSFSIRALEFLKGLSKKEAELIESVAKFVFGGVIHRDMKEHLEKGGLKFDQLILLQEIGILSGVDSLNLNRRYPSSTPNSYTTGIRTSKTGLLITHRDANKLLRVNAYLITQLGQEILQLCAVDVDEDYILAIGSNITNLGYRVTFTRFNQEGRPISNQEITTNSHSHA